MLIGYAAVYVLELIGEQWLGIPIYQWLGAQPDQKRVFSHLATRPPTRSSMTPGRPSGF
jgi:hypothetical protein